MEDLHGKLSDLLHEWLFLEEVTDAEAVENGGDDDDDEDDCSSPRATDPEEKASIIQKMLPLLQSLHECGAKLNDPCIINKTREVCEHILQECKQ